MIEIVEGNIFKTSCDIIVNPANSVGVMGAGLALKFKQLFPAQCEAFNNYCLDKKKTRLLEPLVYSNKNRMYNFIHICMFPTKIHWKDDSKLEYIETNLLKLRAKLKDTDLSIALPALGAGLGNLNFDDVKDLMLIIFEDYPCRVEIYKPM